MEMEAGPDEEEEAAEQDQEEERGGQATGTGNGLTMIDQDSPVRDKSADVVDHSMVDRARAKNDQDTWCFIIQKALAAAHAPMSEGALKKIMAKLVRFGDPGAMGPRQKLLVRRLLEYGEPNVTDRALAWL